VSIAFSGPFTSTYMWDQSAWARSIPEGEFATDDGSQVFVTNVVVLRVGDQSASATVGSGEAMVFRSGTMATGTWNRESETDAWNLRDSQDKPLRLARGRTWVHLALPDTPVTTCSAG
jgi:hypothetical protein